MSKNFIVYFPSVTTDTDERKIIKALNSFCEASAETGITANFRKIPNSPPISEITEREQEVLKLLAHGRSSKEIAGDLGLSAGTVKTHQANLMRKLDIHGIVELVHYALRRGLIKIPDIT